MTLTYTILIILWLSLIVYAVLGGADFGGGIWDFFAFGQEAQRQRRLIGQALGPVWEANHVWLIFLIVGLFTAFPLAFSVLSIALFVPFTLAVIGIVMRGAAFMFRGQVDDATTSRRIWGRVFSTASTITPFFFGAAAAAVASGQVHVQGARVQTDLLAGWTTPFALTIGALALSLCAVLAAVNLIVEAQNSNEPELVEAFRRRAMIAGAITLGLDAMAFILSPFQAPLLLNGALDHALPLIIATALIGVGAATSLLLRRYRLARVLAFTVTAFIFASWGLSQFPYLVPVSVTISNAASPPSTQLALLIGTLVGMALLLPSLWLLFHVFKGKHPALNGQEKAEETKEPTSTQR
ncbi:MAG: cytochrome d ubiquinol oxidase subunit II [Chloroflexi bacterium]|nr:MAG: cytochrome d ubiquinol oxidase subunit II [Chloroflexota bacterium]